MLALLVALLFALAPAPVLPTALAATVPPCATEDSTSCYWDATTRGNGLGRSFVAMPDGSIVYLDGGEPTATDGGWDTLRLTHYARPHHHHHHARPHHQRHARTLPPGGVAIPADMITDPVAGLRTEPGQAHRDWALCRWYVGDTSWVRCPDGYTLAS